MQGIKDVTILMLLLSSAGCISINLPEVPVSHPANSNAPEGFVPLPSPVLAVYHPLPTPESRKTNPELDEIYPDFEPGQAGELDDWLPQRQPDLNGVPEGKYFCTMHPDVVRDEAGYCPRCGMTLVQKQKMEMGHQHGAQPPEP